MLFRAKCAFYSFLAHFLLSADCGTCARRQPRCRFQASVHLGKQSWELCKHSPDVCWKEMVFLPHYLSPRSRKASYSHMLLQCVTSSAPRCPSKLYGIARAAAGPNGLPQFSCWISKFPRRAQQFLGADPLKRKRKSPAGAPPAAGGGRAIAQYRLTVVVIQAQLPPRDWLLATLGVVWPKEPRRCQDMSKTKSAAAEGDGLYWRFLWTSFPHETSFPGCRKN